MADTNAIREITAKLENGIQGIFESDKYAAYLQTMSRFHRYSTRNTLLIHMQMEDATHVAGKEAWEKKFNRQVKEGERGNGIEILAPTPVAKDTRADFTARFDVVTVYDISQTEGESLPVLAEALTGDVARYDLFMDALRAVSPLPIAFEDLPPDTDGKCYYGDRIAIRNGMSEVQTVAAVIHEITHAKLHDLELLPEGETQKDRRAEEIESESVAFTVCSYYGVDTGANSFGYLAEWSRGRELAELNASLDTIRKTAKELIGGIDERYRVLAKERDVAPDVTLAESAAASSKLSANQIYYKYANIVADRAALYAVSSATLLNDDETDARRATDQIVNRVVNDLLLEAGEHYPLFTQYMDNPDFKERLEDYAYIKAYLEPKTAERNAPRNPEHAASDIPAIIAEYAHNAAVSDPQRVGAGVLMTPVFSDGNYNRDGKRIRVTVEEPIGKYQIFSREESGDKKLYFLTASGRIDNTHWHFPSDWDEQQSKRVDHHPTETEFDDALTQIAERFERDMTAPTKWVMYQHAAVLNRLDECETHNEPVRILREEESERNRAAGELQRQEEKRQKQERFDARIDEIAHAITKNEAIEVRHNEYMFDGKNPVLDLFKLYGVNLPLRTQGWVNTRLSSITEGGYSYSTYRNGRASDTFGECLEKLREAVKLTPIEIRRQNPVTATHAENESGSKSYSHTHWLKIPLTASERNEKRMYQEIQSYIDRYPDAAATIYMYEYSLFDYVVKLECNQNWNDLDLSANTMSHSLTRLSRKPDNIINPKPFSIPKRLTETVQDERKEETQMSTAKHEDFGEKIGGAKKDLWRQRGLLSGDLADMNEREADKYVTKDNVWKKPNYQALIDGGVPADVAYFIKTVRDSLATSPAYRRTDDTPELRLARQAEYIDTIREIKAVVESVKTKDDVFDAFSRCMIAGSYYEKVEPGMSGYYASPTEKGRANTVITDNLSRAMFIRNERDYSQKITSKAEKAQFGVSKEDKVPAGYDIRFNDGNYTWSAKDDWKSDTYFVVKGHGILEKNFESREAALKWVQEYAKSRGNDGKKRFVPPQLESIERTGPDYRQSRDMVGDDYLTTFGFKGGEHGNWMTQLDRQASLNYGYDAFKDLAAALKISDNDISYQGALSIAFGARGSGNAAAHYEPLRNVINLTKMNGAGSLAHEWWHGLDDYLGTKMGVEKGYLSEHPRNHPLFKKLIDTIKYKPATPEQAAASAEQADARIKRNAANWMKSFAGSLENNADDAVKAEYAKFHEAFMRGEEGSAEKISELRKMVKGRVIPKKDRELLINFERHLRSIAERQEPATGRVETDYYRNSKAMGKSTEKDGGYWDSNVELTARAFATYILDTLPWRTDYLAGHAESAVDLTVDADGKLEILRAYPEGEERKAINAVFDEIIAELKLQQHLTHDEQAQENSGPSPALEENDTPQEKGAPMEYSELQQKGFEYARSHAHLPLDERLNIIAQTFGVTAASVYVRPCTGKYSGQSDIMLDLEGGGSMGIGMYSNATARKDSTISDCVNNALARFNPEIVAEAKARAASALKAREAEDNANAGQRGLKPYKFLNVELCDGGSDGHTGWYYATIAVGDKIIGFVTSDLSGDIGRGVLTDTVSRANYFVAGGLKDTDVDFIFNNVGHSSFGSSYTVEMSKAALERAEKTLNERGQPATMDEKSMMGHELYDKFTAMFPEFMSGEYSTLLLEAEHATPLRLEWIFGDQFFIAHTTEHDGIRNHNPMVMLGFNSAEKTVTAISLDLSDPLRHDLVYKESEPPDIEMQRNINSFTLQWLDRAAQQRFKPVEATMEVDENGNLSKEGLITDKTVTITFDVDGRAVLPEPKTQDAMPGTPVPKIGIGFGGTPLPVYDSDTGYPKPTPPPKVKLEKTATLDLSLPDPLTSTTARDEYGYTYDGMLPMSNLRAVELFDTDHCIYLLYPDNTESMALDRDEIRNHDGLCGIEREDWERSPVRSAQLAVAANSESARESELLHGTTHVGMFGIYQIPDGIEEARNFRFAPMRELEALGLSVDRQNYELVYTAPLTIRDTQINLHKIYADFQGENPERPSEYAGRSVSISDVIVLQWRGDVSAHYVDGGAGFAKLPVFTGNEKQPETALPEAERFESDHKADIAVSTPPAPTVTEPKVDSSQIGRTDNVIPISAAKTERKAPPAPKGKSSLLEKLERGKQRAAQQRQTDTPKKNEPGRDD